MGEQWHGQFLLRFYPNLKTYLQPTAFLPKGLMTLIVSHSSGPMTEQKHKMEPKKLSPCHQVTSRTNIFIGCTVAKLDTFRIIDWELTPSIMFLSQSAFA